MRAGAADPVIDFDHCGGTIMFGGIKHSAFASGAAADSD